MFEDELTEAADGLDTGYERGKFRMTHRSLG